MGDSQSHDSLVDRCDLSSHRDQSVGDGHSHSFKVPLRTAGPVVGSKSAPNDTRDFRHPAQYMVQTNNECVEPKEHS